MTLSTLSALLLATPFAKELVELAVRLVPLIAQIGALVVRYRGQPVTPAVTHRFETDLADLLRQVGREICAWVYNHLEPEDHLRLPAQLSFDGDWYRRRLEKRFNYMGFGVWLRKGVTAILWDLERP